MTARPIGLSRDLPKSRVMRADVDGVDVAVWRDRDGGVHAWNNRCPHRGMRLSHGFVRGDQLACLYHGWQYGKTGHCAYIPAHPELEPPETIQIQAYSAAERDGVIWVAVQGEVIAPDAPKGVALRSLDFACSEAASRQALASASLEALLNPVSDQYTLAHIFAPEAATIAERKALSRRAEAARLRAEEVSP